MLNKTHFYSIAFLAIKIKKYVLPNVDQYPTIESIAIKAGTLYNLSSSPDLYWIPIYYIKESPN